MRILVLSAAILMLAGPVRAAVDPAVLQAEAGDWRLSEVGGKIACTLTLTRQTSLSGYEVKAPLACRRAFPPLKTVAAWAPDDKGGIVFSDAQAKPIIVFPGQAGGPYEAKAPDGRTWRLEALRETAHAAPVPGRMSGAYKLTALSGATLCDLTLTSNFFGTHGGVTPANCTAPWADKKLATWSIRSGTLTLLDKTGQSVLVMKSTEAGAYVVADPKADLVTLSRR